MSIIDLIKARYPTIPTGLLEEYNNLSKAQKLQTIEQLIELLVKPVRCAPEMALALIFERQNLTMKPNPVGQAWDGNLEELERMAQATGLHIHYPDELFEEDPDVSKVVLLWYDQEDYENELEVSSRKSRYNALAKGLYRLKKSVD